jgi:hypothetical protein
VTLYISDQVEEFRIEVSGRFSGSAVTDAQLAWQAALTANNHGRISIDITRMTGYDHSGCLLLREMYAHGTHIVAGTPRSLLFLHEISSPSGLRRTPSQQVISMPKRVAAVGE